MSPNEISSSDSESDNDSYDSEYFEINTHTAQYSLRSFYDQYLAKKRINLQPTYQRDFVWNNKKQDLLIDSIMRSFVVPNFVVIKTDDNNYSFECIDGQHRFTVIKHYITGEKLNGNYVKWIKKNKEGIKENIFYEKNKNTEINRIKHKRYMTEKEKERFDEFNISVCSISSSKSQKKLNFDNIRLIFDRLQNGERTTALDRLKNHEHPLTQLIRDLDTTRQNFKDTQIGKYMYRIFENNIKGKPISTTKKLFSNLILRYALIITNGLDSITSYLDMNLYKSIEIKSDLVKFKKNISLDDIKASLEKFLEVLDKTAKNKLIKEYIFYILADLYNNKYNSLMKKTLLKNIFDSELFIKYLDEESFCKKGKVPSQETYKNVRDEFLDYCTNNEGSDTEPYDDIVSNKINVIKDVDIISKYISKAKTGKTKKQNITIDSTF
jgi:hypothetical protein